MILPLGLDVETRTYVLTLYSGIIGNFQIMCQYDSDEWGTEDSDSLKVFGQKCGL